MLTFVYVSGQDLNSLSDLYSPGMLVRCVVTSVEKSADGRRSIKLSINPKSVNKGLSASALTSGMVCVHSLSSLLRCFFQCVSGTPHFVLVCDQNRTGSCPHQGNRSGGRGQYWILVMLLQAVAHETYSSDLVICLFILVGRVGKECKLCNSQFSLRKFVVYAEGSI